MKTRKIRIQSDLYAAARQCAEAADMGIGAWIARAVALWSDMLGSDTVGVRRGSSEVIHVPGELGDMTASSIRGAIRNAVAGQADQIERRNYEAALDAYQMIFGGSRKEAELGFIARVQKRRAELIAAGEIDGQAVLPFGDTAEMTHGNEVTK